MQAKFARDWHDTAIIRVGRLGL